MPNPGRPTEEKQRFKDAIEKALRQGFEPYKSGKIGKGAAAAEAARALTEAGFPCKREAMERFVRLQAQKKAQGKEHWSPDWSLYSEPGLAAVAARPGRIYRWILTAAQDDTDAHPRFLTNLKAYAGFLNAALVVAGFTYQKIRHTDRATLAGTYRPELQEYLRFDPLECGPVIFFANINILPTASRPLTGMQTYSRGRDAVFPHAKVAYETVPQMPGAFVPSVMTTGAVTLPNYIEKKAGQKAEFHHVLGATIVEIDAAGAAHCRQITATPDGSFQDLDRLVRDGQVSVGHRVEAVTYGDIHTPSVQDDVMEALWGRNADSMIEALRPRFQFLHDLLSFENWSRHVKDDALHHQLMAQKGMSEMLWHIRRGRDFLRQTEREFCKTYVIAANHNDRLEQWCKAPSDRRDAENYRFWLECQLAMMNAIAEDREDFDVLEWALRNEDSRQLDGIEFPRRGQSVEIC